MVGISRIIFLLGLVVLPSLLPSCACGNGEGYAGRCTSAPDNSDVGGTPGGGTGANGPKIYYLVDSTYQCLDAVTGTMIASYRDSIAVDDTNRKANRRGDKCGNGASTANLYADLDFSQFLTVIGYGADIYQSSASGTTTETWCVLPGTTAAQGEEILVFVDPADGTYLASHAEILPNDRVFTNTVVTRAETAMERTYSGTGFSLVIQVAPSPADPDVHEATYAGRNFLCRTK